MSEIAAPPQTKALAAPLTLPTGSPAGSVEALFSVYHTIDSVGDVVLPGAFAAGQEVPMAAWSHQWGTLPVGKGVIHDTPAGAVFKGQFFLNTEQGRATYETVKSMGGLQEWSFGFGILDSELGSFDGQPVRFLKRLETYEVSPVLVGANRNTGTLGLKAALEDSEKAVWSTAYVNDLPDSAFAYVEAGAKDSEGKTTPRSLRHFPHHDSGGTPDPAHVRNALARIPQSNVPDSAKASAEAHVRRHASGMDIGKAYEPEPDAIFEAMQHLKWVDPEGLADYKAGRVLSEATRRRIRAVRDQWAAQLAELDQLLADTEPPAARAPDPDLLELRAQFADFRARHRDVIGEWGDD